MTNSLRFFLLLIVFIPALAFAQADINAGNCSYGAIPANLTYVQPGYQFRNRQWILKGDALTPSDEYITIEFTPPAILSSYNFNCIRAFLRNSSGGADYIWSSGVSPGVALRYSVSIKLSPGLRASGTYHLLLATNDQNTTFADLQINISAPLYIVISTDWDYPTTDVPGMVGSYVGINIDTILNTMDGFRKMSSGVERPGFAYSHFVGPYIWGEPLRVPAGSNFAPAPTLSSVAERIERWLKARGNDEIGVHIHAWTSAFLSTVPVPSCCLAGTCSPTTVCPTVYPPACCATTTCTAATECKNPPSVISRYLTGWNPSDTSGYSTQIRDYSKEELIALLDHSSQILVSRGFAQPRSFRAGGWTGSPGLLQALASSHAYQLDPTTGKVVVATGQGYLVDSSSAWPDPICSVNPGLCASLRSAAGLSASTTRVSQPYRDVATGILEVPDNDVGIDYQNAANMLVALQANGGNGTPLAQAKMFQFMLHAHTIVGNAAEMGHVFENIDAVLNAFDQGPAVYVRISDLKAVYH